MSHKNLTQFAKTSPSRRLTPLNPPANTSPLTSFARPENQQLAKTIKNACHHRVRRKFLSKWPKPRSSPYRPVSCHLGVTPLLFVSPWLCWLGFFRGLWDIFLGETRNLPTYATFEFLWIILIGLSYYSTALDLIQVQVFCILPRRLQYVQHGRGKIQQNCDATFSCTMLFSI